MTALTPTPRGRRSNPIDTGHDTTVVVIVVAGLGTVVSLGAAVGTALGLL